MADVADVIDFWRDDGSGESEMASSHDGGDRPKLPEVNATDGSGAGSGGQDGAGAAKAGAPRLPTSAGRRISRDINSSRCACCSGKSIVARAKFAVSASSHAGKVH
eukprot:757848-Prorocentrum_minimum.AAC.3